MQIAYTAFQQYIRAKSIVRTMNSDDSNGDAETGFWRGILVRLGWLRNKAPPDSEVSGLSMPFITSNVNEATAFEASLTPSADLETNFRLRLQRSTSPSPPSSSQSQASKPRGKWTMTHGFFVAMGGIAIQIPDGGENEVVSENTLLNFFPARTPAKNQEPKPRTSMTLTPEGVEYLKDAGEDTSRLIPEIPVGHIQDKSKGSALAKTLVCIQGEPDLLHILLV